MKINKTLSLIIYDALINFGALFMPLILKARVKKQKEDIGRIQERYGIAQINRPNGKLIWFHGASVGETIIGINLANQLLEKAPDMHFLFTTQTKTSAQIIEKQQNNRFIHQYFPFDKSEFSQSFINHWQPDLACFLEGEIWPNTLLNLCKNGIDTILLNARMTNKSLRNWLRFNKSAKQLFAVFSYIQAANNLSKQGIEAWGGKVSSHIANLKLSSAPLKYDANIAKDLSNEIGNRNIWLAASMHLGEEKIIFQAHNTLLMADRNALLIIAPRHPNNAEAIILEAQKQGLKVARRSLGQKIQKSDNIYLWDTLGELGIAYKIVPVSLICGSLIDDIGGHNPIEPAQIGSVILSGPYIHNFADIFSDLSQIKGADIIENPNAHSIAINIAKYWGDNDLVVQSSKNALQYINASKNCAQEIISIIENKVRGH